MFFSKHVLPISVNNSDASLNLSRVALNTATFSLHFRSVLGRAFLFDHTSSDRKVRSRQTFVPSKGGNYEMLTFLLTNCSYRKASINVINERFR